MGLPEEEGVGQRDADGVPAQPRTRPVPQRELGGLLGGGPVPSPPHGVFREFRQTPARRCGETIHMFLPPSRLLSRCLARSTAVNTQTQEVMTSILIKKKKADAAGSPVQPNKHVDQ